ncbi:ATP-binding protein [Ramlibacter pallidus]|uniref:Sensor histidine kinase n=1 Tax=Ramlibacter pallidus TaxID=2780087 RepID=A0ABR9S5T5_9BURK|nr:ATP-binding protein [Ramlibacter pallidus]MBE7368877.1 sensor histidine kinase [Ramlibacter pallidus]
MSSINIERAVKNIRSTTTVFTPIVEAVVNSIQAIELTNRTDGHIVVSIKRSPQQEIDDESRVVDVAVTDTGVGFTKANRDSFDTLYSDQKLAIGGKGFGRFTWLKYFDSVQVESAYAEEGAYWLRSFSMGKNNDIIVKETVEPSTEERAYAKVLLRGELTGQLPQKLSTIAKGLVEVLLPYFTTEGYVCPEITLTEEDGSSSISLNGYLRSEDPDIVEMPLAQQEFKLEGSLGRESFRVRVFKLYAPRNKISKISLVAHKREVTETSIAVYVPEFADEFAEPPASAGGRGRNFILRAYVFGEYLDRNVLLERGAFEFQKENDVAFGISQVEIEREAAELARAAVADQVTSRQDRKKAALQRYADEKAPWHKTTLKEMDITRLPMNASEEQMESYLHLQKYETEVRVRRDVTQLLASNDLDDVRNKAAQLAERISQSSQSELVHYVALRRYVLELFEKSLQLRGDGKYETEGTVHQVIFPKRTDDQTTRYEAHNLWILDERLTFTTYLSSDLPLTGANDRPDIAAFERPVAFRGDNEPSNPVTIFEFKRPQRDDFTNASSSDDPVQQVIRYVNSIRAGKFRTPEGRNIHVSDTTPFYGYVVCDLSAKVEEWLKTEKNFKRMPDGLGWFNWFDNINLYVEVLSWDKILRDAQMRNRIFFHKLGLT